MCFWATKKYTNELYDLMNNKGKKIFYKVTSETRRSPQFWNSKCNYKKGAIVYGSEGDRRTRRKKIRCDDNMSSGIYVCVTRADAKRHVEMLRNGGRHPYKILEVEADKEDLIGCGWCEQAKSAVFKKVKVLN